MLARSKYDVVLMDLRMPGMDGLTAIRLLRQEAEPLGSIPVIVVTADTAPDLKARCLEAGANDIILKPVALSALIDAIGRAVVNSSSDDLLLD
jgi:CheY-like chemotaxis protein